MNTSTATNQKPTTLSTRELSGSKASPGQLRRHSFTRTASAARRGFTLLEMVLVAVLIAALATIVVVNVAGKSNKAKVKFTMTRLAQIKGQLTEYLTDYGSYPPTLDNLVTAGKGYIDKVPLDDFRRPLNYQFPGSAGDAKRPYDLYSTGIDGIQGTPDDIDIWTMDDMPPG